MASKGLTVSWSKMQTFLKCQRQYELSYVEGLDAKPKADDRPKLLGSAIHAAIQAAIQYVFQTVTPDEKELTRLAVQAARNYIRDNTVANATVYNYERGQHEVNSAYYDMMNELLIVAPVLAEYHVPRIGIGKRFRPVSRGELVKGAGDTCAVEWTINHKLKTHTITGIVDTVLWDEEAGDYVIVDWKVRDSFPHDTMALLDGQLHLYAAILNAQGAKIGRVCMFQLKSKTPSPASISVRTSLPNTGAASYDTTWEYWVKTLPAGINPEEYREQMLPKLKQDSDFIRPVFNGVTATSSSLALDNALQTITAMVQANKQLAKGEGLPAVLSSTQCRFCPFWRLCAGALRYGGDVTEVVETEYIKK